MCWGCVIGLRLLAIFPAFPPMALLLLLLLLLLGALLRFYLNVCRVDGIGLPVRLIHICCWFIRVSCGRVADAAAAAAAAAAEVKPAIFE